MSAKRSVMTLFSSPACPLSHAARIVLCEKNIAAEVAQVQAGELPEDVIDLNPYGTLPTLVDRDLVLYEPKVILEYLDERYPHPPLLPIDPVSRAQSRQLMHRIGREWYGPIIDLDSRSDKKVDKARTTLRDLLTQASPIFGAKPYFMSDEMTLVDCLIAPILWRLPVYGIELAKPARTTIHDYARRVFQRDSFRHSLSDAEREMRAPS